MTQHTARAAIPDRASRLRFLGLSTVILALGLLVRLVDLNQLPLFVDEGIHIARAQQLAAGQIGYPLLMNGKFLWGFTLALFNPLGPAPIWVSRAVMAIFSTLSGAASIALGARLGARRVGLLAGILYAVLPYAVFYDRQALADPFSSAFGSVAVVLALRLASKRQLWLVAPLALALAAATLAKLTGVSYFTFLFLALAFLPVSWKERRNLAAKYMAGGILTGACLLLFLIAFSGQLGQDTGNLIGQRVGFVECPPLLCQGDLSEQVRRLQATGSGLFELISPYFGWPLVALALLAWLPTPRRNGRLAVCLFLFLLTMLLGFWFSVKQDLTLAPRYLTFAAVPTAVLAAQGIASLAHWAGQRLHWSASPRVELLLAGLLSLVTLGSMANTVPLIFAPAQAQLPSFDRWQYFTGPFATPGLREMAAIIQANEAHNPLPSLVVVENFFNRDTSVAAYFEQDHLNLIGHNQDWLPAIAQGLTRGQGIYVIDEVPTIEANPSSLISGLATQELARYPHLNGASQLRLQKATGVEDALRQKFFDQLFTPPSELTADYQALSAYLASQDSEAVLLVYPPTLAPQFATLTSLKLHAVGDSWPLDKTATASALRQWTADQASIKMVFLQQTQGDPDRYSETWLNTHLFRLSEQWFGALRLVEYAGDGPVAQTLPVNARFGDQIVLESVEIVDEASPAGGVVRLRLTWRTETAISQPLKVFVHLFDQQGIVAQYDGQPVGELRPTTSWMVGERIVDQMALRLPPEATPGTYQLRIGLYDLRTQDRLPMRLPDGSTGEYCVVGHIRLEP